MSADECSIIATKSLETSSELVVCKYGSKDKIGGAIVQVQVPKKTLLLFRIFRNINEDCPSEDNSFYANIPLIQGAKNVPIYFTKAELDLFFELAAKEPLTIQNIKNCAITPKLSYKFIQLANFLDYEIYLHTLCKYSAFLIRES